MGKKLKPFINIGPGETIKDELEARNWTQSDLAEITSMSLKNINHLLNSKIAISIEMAKLLSKAFGQSPKFWLNLDINYRCRLEEETQKEKEAEIKAKIYELMPIGEMVRKGWFKKPVDTKSLVDQVKKFWGIETLEKSFLDERSLPAFRTSEAFNDRFDVNNSKIWHKMAENCAQKIKVERFNKKKVREIAETLHSFTVHDNGVKKVIEALNKSGVKFLVLSHLKKTYLDGAAFVHEKNPVIVYTMRYDRIDNFYFVLAHELAHLILHLDENPKGFMDDLSAVSTNEREIEANEFAKKILHIDDLSDLKEYTVFKENLVKEKAAKYQVNPAIILGAIQNKTGNYRSQLNKKLKTKVSDKIPKKLIFG